MSLHCSPIQVPKSNMLTELEIILIMAQWCFGYGTMVFWLWHNGVLVMAQCFKTRPYYKPKCVSLMTDNAHGF